MSNLPKHPRQPSGDGPTAHTATHGDYVVLEIATAVKAFVNRRTTPLVYARNRGVITGEQFDAGERFARYARVAYHSGAGRRDPLDMTPRGESHETESQAEYIARARDLLRRLQDRIPPDRWYVLYSVAVEEEPAGGGRGRRFKLLTEALDAAAVVFGILAEK